LGNPDPRCRGSGWDSVWLVGGNWAFPASRPSLLSAAFAGNGVPACRPLGGAFYETESSPMRREAYWAGAPLAFAAAGVALWFILIPGRSGAG
jgi:hypothetical protein